ncbi:MAG: class I SAM-dependent methyltransferase, partial [Pseudomonadota bacterium]
VRTRCAQILERNPNASLPHRVLGVVAARAGDAAEAERRFEAAIAGVPAHREPYENLARLLVGRARFEEALDALARLAGAFPGPLTFAEAQIAAEARLGVGDVEGALEATLDALDLEPESESALRSFGFVLDRTTATQPSERYRRAVYKLATHRELLSRSDHMAACFLVAQAIQDLGEEQPRYSDLSPEIRELLRAVLFNRFVPVLSVEKLLIGLRAQILKKVAGSETGEGVSEELLDLAEAMARHSYTTEYLWEETAEETAQLEILRGRVEARLAEGAPVAARDLFTLGAYRDLSKIDAVRAWVAALAEQDPHSVDPTLELLVFNPIAEAMIAPALLAVTEIEDGVSSAVRAQYEANPYPRWRIVRQSHPTPYLDHIRSVIQPNRTALSPTSDAPKVLIAGCGTGQHPISAARGYRDSTVLAVDLSRASLAYAARQAIALGVGNIRFAQADILKLPETDVRFDVVEAGGVIHHMRDPEEGLRALLSVLKPPASTTSNRTSVSGSFKM